MLTSKPQMICKKDRNGRSCYFNCDLYYGKKEYGRMTDTPLYKFTKERYEGWKAILDKETIKRGEEYVINTVCLCQRHFEKCYLSNSKILTKNAVPTLHLERQKKSRSSKGRKGECTSTNHCPVAHFQRRLMLDFVKKHPIIASEHYKDMDQRTELVKEMAYLLNSKGGAAKSPEQWLATWDRWKLGLNNKVTRHDKRAEGGPSDRSLTCLDQELLDFLLDLKEYGTAGSVAPAQEKIMGEEDRSKLCDDILESEDKPEEVVPEKTTSTSEKTPGLPPENTSKPGPSKNVTKRKTHYVRQRHKVPLRLHCEPVASIEKNPEEELFCLRERENYVLKVYHYLESEYKYLNEKFGSINELSPLGHILRRTANATGFTETAVKKILEREMLKNAMAEGRQETAEAGNKEEIYEAEILSAMEFSDGSNGGVSTFSEEMTDEDLDLKVKLEFEEQTPEDILSNGIGLKITDTAPGITMDSNPETHIVSNPGSDVTSNVIDSVTVHGNESLVKMEVIDDEINCAEVTEGDLGYQTPVTEGITEECLVSDKRITDHQVTQDSLGYQKVTEQVRLKEESLHCEPRFTEDDLGLEERVTEKEQKVTEHKDMSEEPLINVQMVSDQGDSETTPLSDILFCDDSPDALRITTNHHSPVHLTADEVNPELHDVKISPWTPDIVKVESVLNKESREDSASDIPWRYN